MANDVRAVGAVTVGAQGVRDTFDRMKAAGQSVPVPNYRERMDRLARLAGVLRRRQDEIAATISRDFGNRSVHETKFAEIMTVLDIIKHLRKNLKDWMRPEKRSVSMKYWPAKVRVVRQPLGIVGVISTWNYPLHISLAPAAAAIAAGNRVMIKPSEHSPLTSELLRDLCAEAFEPDVVAIVTGGVDIGMAFSRLPFDHLFFTGGTAIGRRIMAAAAENLVPVTLELGGKSPAIIHPDYQIDQAAARIAWGKLLNAGQTCIAPDYALVHENRVEAFVEAYRGAVARSYPTLENNPDYTSIVNGGQYARLMGLIEDAVAKGARKIEINSAGEALAGANRKIAPTLLLNVDDGMSVMQEEIFGPILPIVSFRALEDAIAYVNSHPRPLALYYFDEDRDRVAHVLERTVAGGVSINETMLHAGIETAPFGGIGLSGMGAYHGREGFETFSHRKTVFFQPKYNFTRLLSPPYAKRVDTLLRLLIG